MNASSSEQVTVISDNKISIEHGRLIIRDQTDGQFVVIEADQIKELVHWIIEALP